MVVISIFSENKGKHWADVEYTVNEVMDLDLEIKFQSYQPKQTKQDIKFNHLILA